MTIYLGIRISVTISRIVSGLNIGTVSVTTLSHTKMFKLGWVGLVGSGIRVERLKG